MNFSDRADTSSAAGSSNTVPRRARGRGRGRGGRGSFRGRGRGGRGGPPMFEKATAEDSVVHSDSAQATGKGKEGASRPPLTHFISIPLGQNADFRTTVSTFTDALLATTPAIPGLDSTIVIPARRMHFTLGVMSLADVGEHSVETATKLLHALKPQILQLLGGDKLRVSLDSMDIMKPMRHDPEQAHVMWVGPAQGTDADRFMAVGRLVQKAFLEAGLLADQRPLKASLHCTVLNTIYRKPRPKGARVPFSYPSVLASNALKAILGSAGVGGAGLDVAEKKGPVRVNLGEWEMNEIQICQMGSWGPEGEYVAVARCVLDGRPA